MMYLRTLRHSANPSRFVRFDPSLCSLSRFASTETSTQAKVSKPLRILFCGSDTFSAASLRALYAEQQRNPDGIRSIDVMVRPGKRSGRGMKIRDGELQFLQFSMVPFNMLSSTVEICR
jgi:methionyl-tRNA formyltransferase